MKDKKKKVLDKEQAIEARANDGMFGWWGKLTNNSKLSYYLLISFIVLMLIITFVILVITKAI